MFFTRAGVRSFSPQPNPLHKGRGYRAIFPGAGSRVRLAHPVTYPYLRSRGFTALPPSCSSNCAVKRRRFQHFIAGGVRRNVRSRIHHQRVGQAEVMTRLCHCLRAAACEMTRRAISSSSPKRTPSGYWQNTTPVSARDPFSFHCVPYRERDGFARAG